jgi:hypothetical protein
MQRQRWNKWSYCVAHPGSPSAVRRPRLFFRSELWIALLGPSVEEGIVGIGSTVAAALRAFDSHIWLSCVHGSPRWVQSVRCANRVRERTVPIAILNPIQNLAEEFQD